MLSLETLAAGDFLGLRSLGIEVQRPQGKMGEENEPLENRNGSGAWGNWTIFCFKMHLWTVRDVYISQAMSMFANGNWIKMIHAKTSTKERRKKANLVHFHDFNASIFPEISLLWIPTSVAALFPKTAGPFSEESDGAHFSKMARARF